jgi:phospholipase C
MVAMEHPRSRKGRARTGVATVILAATAIFLPTSPSPATTPAATPPPPLIVIFMENKSAGQVLGNPAMPYLNHFANSGLRFTDYHEGDPTGPSLPDYLQVAAGSSCGKTDDTTQAGDPTIGSVCPTTVWNQLQRAGVTWGVYLEGMPSACSPVSTYDDIATDGQYALKHNPATPFPAIWGRPKLCAKHVLPYTSFDVSALRAVSFIAPNQCDDQHGLSSSLWTNCLSGTSELFTRGDDWLAARVPAMLRAGATVMITYDEDNTLYAVVRGPGISTGTDGTAYTHYSTLAAIEARFGLRKL